MGSGWTDSILDQASFGCKWRKVLLNTSSNSFFQPLFGGTIHPTLFLFCILFFFCFLCCFVGFQSQPLNLTCSLVVHVFVFYFVIVKGAYILYKNQKCCDPQRLNWSLSQFVCYSTHWTIFYPHFYGKSIDPWFLQLWNTVSSVSKKLAVPSIAFLLC